MEIDFHKVCDKLKEQEFCVLVSEEYGYGYWFWFPLISSPQELVELWKKVDDVRPFYSDIKIFMSGETKQAMDVEEYELWHELKQSRTLPFIHMHWNDDSWLRVGAETIYHKGYTDV